jgi:hypothetical protein
MRSERKIASYRETLVAFRLGASVRALALLLVAGGCTVLGSPSRVKAGELYAAGQPRYDAYFSEVHAFQVALKLASDAPDTTIEQSTQVFLSTGALRLDVSGGDAHVVAAGDAKGRAAPEAVLGAVEMVARAEVERAKTLGAIPAKLADLSKTGHDLETHIGGDFGEAGGQKPFEVRQELRESYTVLADIGARAKPETKAAEDFVAQLQRAVANGSVALVRQASVEYPRSTPPKPKREEHVSVKTTAAFHAEGVAPRGSPAATKPAKPAKPADTGEVFQP